MQPAVGHAVDIVLSRVEVFFRILGWTSDLSVETLVNPSTLELSVSCACDDSGVRVLWWSELRSSTACVSLSTRIVLTLESLCVAVATRRFHSSITPIIIVRVVGWSSSAENAVRHSWAFLPRKGPANPSEVFGHFFNVFVSFEFCRDRLNIRVAYADPVEGQFTRVNASETPQECVKIWRKP